MLPDVSQIDPMLTACFGVSVCALGGVLGWVKRGLIEGRERAEIVACLRQTINQELVEKEREIDMLSLELKRLNSTESLANLSREVTKLEGQFDDAVCASVLRLIESGKLSLWDAVNRAHSRLIASQQVRKGGKFAGRE